MKPVTGLQFAMLLALSLLFPHLGQAQLVFQDAADLPQPLIFHAYATDGAAVYSINGQTTATRTISTQVIRHDPAANATTVLAEGLTPKISAVAEYVPATGKLYVLGGKDPRGPSASFFMGVEAIDVKTGQVEKLALTNPAPSSYGGSAEWQNKIYFFGGTTPEGKASTKLTVFDPQARTFTSLPDLPEGGQLNGDIVNGVLYVFGGFNAETKATSDRIQAYDISAKTWRNVGQLPKPVSATAVARHGNHIYLVGAYDDVNFIGRFEANTQQFAPLTTNLKGRRHAGAAVAQNQLFVFGGNQDSTPTSELTSLQRAGLVSAAASAKSKK